MNCIIIDDEPLARKGVKLLCDQIGCILVSAEFSSAIESHTFLQKNKNIDLIFLDIEMPGLNGLEFIRTLPHNVHIILTTAYPQYALEAFELDVVDYLLKPIKLDRFLKAINKVNDLLQSSHSEYALDQSDKEFIYIKSERKYVKLLLENIKYIKGQKDYVMIYTTDSRYMTAMNIGTAIAKLPDTLFARVSKSYIINVSWITEIDTDFVFLDDIDIPLGLTFKEDFLKKFVKGKLLER